MNNSFTYSTTSIATSTSHITTERATWYLKTWWRCSKQSAARSPSTKSKIVSSTRRSTRTRWVLKTLRSITTIFDRWIHSCYIEVWHLIKYKSLASEPLLLVSVMLFSCWLGWRSSCWWWLLRCCRFISSRGDGSASEKEVTMMSCVGLISLCSPKMRSILLERSILDIFRDIVYFPYITKIIGAYLRVAATKPNP